MLNIPLQQPLPAGVSDTEDKEQRDRSHVKKANVLSKLATVEPQAVHPAAQSAADDPELAMLIAAAPFIVNLHTAHNRAWSTGMHRRWKRLAF